MMEDPHVRVNDEDLVRTIRINRPHRRNALTAQTAVEIREAVLGAPAADIEVIVLTGTGEHFSAGGDAAAILDINESPDDAVALHLMRDFHTMIEAIWSSELPVIAAASGSVYGGAFNLALSCDLIIASADARFCQVFLRRGVAPDLGGTYLLPRLVGMQRAKQLIYLTEELTAEEAQSLGLVNVVVATSKEVQTQARELAIRLVHTPSHALAMTKHLINSTAGMDFHGALEIEAHVQAALLRSNDVREGFSAFGTRV